MRTIRSVLVAAATLLAVLPGCQQPVPTTMDVEVIGEGTVAIAETGEVCDPTCASRQEGGSDYRWSLTAAAEPGWEFDVWDTEPGSTCPTTAVEIPSFVATVPAEGGSYVCLAHFVPAEEDDPAELTEDPMGDAAADVVGVTTARTPAGGIVVRIRTNAAFPPSDSLYSWYATVTLYPDATAPQVASSTLQRHAGVRDTNVTGVAESAVDLTEVPDGLVVHFLAPITASHASIETGVMLTPSSTRRSDEVPDGAGRLVISDRIAEAP